MIDLLKMSQGDKMATEFVAAAEDQARLCRADKCPHQGGGSYEDGSDWWDEGSFIGRKLQS